MDIKEATGYGAGEWKFAGVVGVVLIIALLGLKACFGGGSESKVAASRETAEIVRNSNLDGSVLQVKRYLKANAKDASSLEFIEWSPVRKAADNSYLVRVKYRAKNSFGGYVVENQIFQLSPSGDVVSVGQAQ